MRISIDICAYLDYMTGMPRLNIYLPDDVYDLASKWRSSANLSEICARAIKDEFHAADAYRAPGTLLNTFTPAGKLETELAEKLGLFEVHIVDTPTDYTRLRDDIGKIAAAYIDRQICDGSYLAIAGGRQMWCVVRNLSPRRVRATITALGMHQVDPELLHAHPNTLATLLWLLYSPRSQAHVVDAIQRAERWPADPQAKTSPTYFVLSSCSPFDPQSSFARLLGAEVVTSLKERRVSGDYAYVFFDNDGNEIELPIAAPHFRLSGHTLRTMSSRSDVRTILVAGGDKKMGSIRATIKAGFCNMLVTDNETAQRLLE